MSIPEAVGNLVVGLKSGWLGFASWLVRLLPQSSGLPVFALTIWSLLIMFALFVTIFGTLILASGLPPPDAPPPTAKKQHMVVVNVVGKDGEQGRPPEVVAPTTNLLLDVSVSPPAPAPPPVAGESPTQSVEVTVSEAHGPSSDSPSADGGDRGNDLIVVLDKEKIVKTTERTPPVVRPPDPAKLPFGQVEFEPRRHRVGPGQRAEIRGIANRLRERAGIVLVAGDSDDCRWSRLAERRARSVGKALRRELRCCSRWRWRSRNRGRQVHTQAAADLPGMAEGSCEKKERPTVAVYLLEKLK